MPRSRKSATPGVAVECAACGTSRILLHPTLAGDMCRVCAAKRGSEAAARALTSIPLAERFRIGTTITPTGCWAWQGYHYGNGYAAISINGRQRLAHRVSYEVHVGPIPQGLVVDHLCMQKGCVNPKHLEPVTQAENLRRAREAAR